MTIFDHAAEAAAALNTKVSIQRVTTCGHGCYSLGAAFDHAGTTAVEFVQNLVTITAVSLRTTSDGHRDLTATIHADTCPEAACERRSSGAQFARTYQARIPGWSLRRPANLETLAADLLLAAREGDTEGAKRIVRGIAIHLDITAGRTPR
ncbi:hypothetical protein ACFVUN_08990 [Kitasatospora griseola]|uniref:hypothetical protein n=1 Tax=Kitasatospora griseola TaxID=2064 RepID=UPI0036DD0EFE